MSDELPDKSEQTAKSAKWTAPELGVIEVSDLTEQFNGGAGDGNTGS